MNDDIVINVELPNAMAWALAEFLKRAGVGDYRALAASEREACDMQEAGEKVRTALAEKGVAPR